MFLSHGQWRLQSGPYQSPSGPQASGGQEKGILDSILSLALAQYLTL